MGRHKDLMERISNVIDKARVVRDAYVAMTTAEFAGSEEFKTLEDAEQELAKAVDYLDE